AWPALASTRTARATTFTAAAATFTAFTRARTGLQSARARTNTTIFVTLRQQRACISLFQHREIQTESRIVIVRSHVEPLRAQSEICRREKPEILPTRIPRGPNGIRQPVSDLLRLTALDVADEDRVIQRTQTTCIRDPLRIRTPHRIQRALRHHPRILAHNLRLLGRDIEHPHFQIRVSEQKLFRIRRP